MPANHVHYQERDLNINRPKGGNATRSCEVANQAMSSSRTPPMKHATATEPAQRLANLKWEECDCPLCGADRRLSRLRYQFELSAYHQCGQCGLVYLSPRLDEADMAILYQGQDYFAGEGSLGYETYEEDASTYRRTFERRLATLARFKDNGQLLDVGFGSGIFLDVAIAHGYDAHGIDISAYAVEKRSVDLGSRVRQASVESAPYEPGRFDAITLFDVFEHVYQPKNFVAKLARLLAPEGVVLVATPNFDSWMRWICGRKTVSFKIPEHVCYYTRHTVERAVSDEFHVVHSESIGQYCTVQFLQRRLSDISPLVGTFFGVGLKTFGLSHWKPHVPSGSLITVLAKK